ncbi:basic form of pathogenesis-related protein 1-like [Salvia divinorum]|uniref:Basic form of pathogenesis-related protein 1-like n=1 Tax=Salvia divinorum TaxID=28513 RepID=A0ABD1HN40_SALDI
MVALSLSQQIHAQNRPEDYVDAHNVARATVGVGPLVWNETVAEYARAYAEVRSNDCDMRHSDGPYGENLAAGSWNVSAEEAVDMWLDEKPLYDAGTSLYGWTFVICNYDPPGNIVGERPF